MKKLKVGDVVFVVDQTKRHSTTPPRMRDAQIVRIGKKYGYCDDGIEDKCFGLSSWQSVHGDCNARTNGFGFDVYESRQEYERATHARNEYSRLAARLKRDSYSIIELPPDAVQKIHAVLDEVETKGAK
jgi:hypothetical protein